MDGLPPTSDHDLLIEVNTNVKNLAANLNSYTESNNRLTQDHELRIRQLENANQQLIGSQEAQKRHMSVVTWVGGLVGLALTIWGFFKGS